MKKDVRLITFHASHNFGSVMQAYALKHAVEGMGNSCRIINFRPASQLDKYSAIPRLYGGKMLLRSIANRVSQPMGWKRTHAAYEEFIAGHLTDEPAIVDIAGLVRVEADVLLTGSDQVWGYQIPEFVRSREDVRPAYYYSFATGRKVSYASSTGTATRDQLEPYAKYLRLYDRISVREEASVEVVESLLPGREVACVLDPTFLLSADEYRDLLEGVPRPSLPEGAYCLIYSLQGVSSRKDWLELARGVRKSLGLPIISASHFIPLKGPGVKAVTEIGPLDVLALFSNASYVLTDTFHGTLFSTHFGKQFVTFTPGRNDPRISDITNRLGLEGRVARTPDEGVGLLSRPVDYERVDAIRRSETERSLGYLIEALGN